MLKDNREPGWLRQRGEASLADVHRTVAVRPDVGTWRRQVAFVGPGYLVAVGYMDPGNWATSLAGGSKFGYTLLVVAADLQHHGDRAAVAVRPARHRIRPRPRPGLPRRLSASPWSPVLWFLAEIAIIATDIAEVIGTAIGLNLIFGIPLEIGVIITALDVFVILYLQKLGFRWVEALIITLLGVIAICFVVQIALADPDWGAVIRGFAPTTDDRDQPATCSTWRSASSARP